MALDPTMELIRSLDDPERYVTKERVAVFRPHKRTFPGRKNPDGSMTQAETIEVTDSDLKDIAANINSHYEKEGQLVKLVIGHRQQDPKLPETLQPPVVGYARHYRAEIVDRPGGKAIRLTHTEHIRKDTPFSSAVLAGQYPERSPEYDPKRKLITGVALLTRDQALPLGTVAYEGGRALYAMGATMDGMTDDLPGQMNAGAGSEDWTPDDDVQYGRFCKYMKKYQATAPAAMGPMNGSLPDSKAAPDGLSYGSTGKTINYSADPHFVSLKTRIAELEAQKAQADRIAIQAQCQSLLEPLTKQRKFHYEKELNSLMNMKTAEERSFHVHYILDHYQALPGGDMIRLADSIHYAAQPDVPDIFRKPAGYDKAMGILRDNPGMAWSDALRAANENKAA